MTNQTLVRLSAVSSLIGAALFAVGNALHPADHTASSQHAATWVGSHVVMLVAAVAIAAGLPGLYVRVLRPAGAPGFAATAVLGLGAMGLLPTLYHDAFVVSALDGTGERLVEEAGASVVLALSGTVFMAGWALLGWAALRAPQLPRWTGGVLLASVVTVMAGPALPGSEGTWIIPGTIVFSLAVARMALASLDDVRDERYHREVEAAVPY